MKWLSICLLLFIGSAALAQNPPANPPTTTTDPTGKSCTADSVLNYVPSGKLFTCDATGHFAAVAPVVPIAGSSGQVIVNSSGAYAGVGADPIASATVQGAFNNLSPNANNTLINLQTALAKTAQGTSDTRIAVLGDSTTYGQNGTFGSTYANASSWTSFLGPTGLPISSCGFGIATGDSRWSAGANWAGQSNIGFGSHGSYQGTIPGGGTTGTLVFTPNVSLAGGLGCFDKFDSFDVYYPRQSFITGSATLNMWCSGNGLTGSTVTVAALGTDGAYKSTITCPSEGTFNQLNVTVTGTQSGSGFGIISAVGAFDSKEKRIRIDNMGQSGTTTADWVNSGSWESLQHITAYAPDAAIIMLGINDAGNSVTAATYASHIQTLINTVTAAAPGDTILATMVPSGATGTYQTFEPQYVSTGGTNSLYGLASTNNLPIIDLYKFLGGIDGTGWARAGDNLHPGPNGYPAIGRFIGNALQPILGNYQACRIGAPCALSLSAVNPQTGTYQALAADFLNYKTITVASGTFTVTLVASGSQPAAGQYIKIVNYGSGVVTVARSGQNINGGTSSLTVPAASATAPTEAWVISDGTNYFASLGQIPASNTTLTIANGTSALATGAISSATCATVVTTTATGTATTDNIMADFNADPTGVTGYAPSASGMLTIIKYPTSGNVNFKVCNNTGGSITPGAITLNWRVVR